MLGVITFGMTSTVFAQDETSEATTEATSEVTEEQAAAPAPQAAPVAQAQEQAQASEQASEEKNEGFHKVLKTKFIEGGAMFMFFVAVCLILGLALCIERIIYLSLASADTQKLLSGVEASLENGDVEAAKTICRNTRGPIASIFYQGLLR